MTDPRTNTVMSNTPARRNASGPVISLAAGLQSTPGSYRDDAAMATPVKTTVTELPESRVRVQAEVPPEEVERRLQQAASRLGREMRVPGFRKGKVPAPVVIRRLGREAVLDEAVRSALGNWYVDALDGAGVNPVGDPELDLGDLPDQGQPLSFSIEIAVRPPARLGRYKGLKVGRREPGVDDEALAAELDRLRERFATLDTVEREAASGDHLVIDYLGRIDGEPFEGGEGRDQLLELGSGRLIPGFEEQLVGTRAGDAREVEVTFPDEYPGQLGGRHATFEVKVSEVKAKRLPELDDEFASESSEFDTLAELREDIASRLREADERAVEREFREAVLDAVAAQASIDLPDRLVHARAHELLGQTLRALAGQGIAKETYLQLAGKDEETLAHEAEPDAAAALRREAVLEAVIEAEAIAPADEELLSELESAAEDGGASAQELLERVRAGGALERLREDVAQRKAIDLLVAESKPVPAETAAAREQLWTPEKEGERSSGGRLWTPGD